MGNKINILYLSYWNTSDVLTKATVLPSLMILESFVEIENLVWCNIERLETKKRENLGSKIKHVPLKSHTKNLNTIGQILDFILLPRLLKRTLEDYNIDLIIARSSLAGALAYMAHKKHKIDYVVESFEPHAEYMMHSGVWNKYGLKYIFQKHWERKQLETAIELITVSYNFKDFLVKSGSNSQNIKVAPCAVNLKKIAFNVEARKNIRVKLGWSDSIIGIYTGKLGGLYFETKSLLLFKFAFEEFGDAFRLIILTNQPKKWISRKLAEYNIPKDKTLVTFVEHESITSFLSSADFAFAPIKNSPASKFCSPIKIGESWATGLPVLLTENIGDESDIISREGGGIIFKPSEQGLRRGIIKMKNLLESGLNKKDLYHLAKKHKSFSHTKNVYKDLINRLINKRQVL